MTSFSLKTKIYHSWSRFPFIEFQLTIALTLPVWSFTLVLTPFFLIEVTDADQTTWSISPSGSPTFRYRDLQTEVESDSTTGDIARVVGKQAGAAVAVATDPTTENGTATADVTVVAPAPGSNTRFTVSLTNFIKMNNAIAPSSICFTGIVPRTLSYKGDDRPFDPNSNAFRTRTIVTIDTDPAIAPTGQLGGAQKLTGITKSYARYNSLDANGDLTPAALADTTEEDCSLLHQTGQEGSDGFHGEVERLSPTQVEVRLHGFASNPLAAIQCSIDWNITVWVDTSSGQYTYSGTHDVFPSYELAISGVNVYTALEDFSFGLCGIFPDVTPSGNGPLP